LLRVGIRVCLGEILMMPSAWKLIVYGLVFVIGCLVAAPNLFTHSQLSSWPGWLPTKQVALGLDLQGGAHLVLEIDLKALRKEQLQSLLADATATLRAARLPCFDTQLQNDAVIRCKDAAQTVQALRTLQAKAAPAIASGGQVALGDDGAIHLQLDEAAMLSRQASAIEQSVEIVRRRIDAVGVAEPTVQALGADRILVQLPGVQDPAAIRTLLGSTAKLTFHRVQGVVESGNQAAPPGLMRVPDASGEFAYVVDAQPMLNGERLVQANSSMDSRDGRPVVSFRLDDLGTTQFAKITRENVGRAFAIVLDGRVLSAPVIHEPIVGGSGQIAGNFTLAETTSLAALLRAGALPVPLTIIEERMVGPDLGADAIRIGAITGVVGLGLVLGFMTVLYGAWGLVANLALIVNVVLTLAALRLFGVTLTLPGIAGIVLGIGLAVDANVLINERIREETRNGKKAYAALQSGFKRAYAAIVDSNVTTLIATALLFWVGSGPVQGFAITMALGIAISMFTAVSVVHAVMATWIARRRPQQFVIGSLLPAKLLRRTPSFQFMRARFAGIGVSLVLSVASVVLFFNPGLNYGVDFTGGIMIEVSLPDSASIARLRDRLEQLDAGEISLQQVTGSASTLVRIEQPPGADDAIRTQIAERAKAAIAGAEPQARFDRVDIVGPKVSSELADSGVLAVVLASVAMLIYIWARFEWHFAVGAIATLVLDITKTIGFFAITGLEFNLTAIAAVLTLIGYSVNDKVVVYDRMRENLQLHPEQSLRTIIDRSINETLARSLYTSVTAFLAMVPMAIWGGAAVQSFAIPMVFGIVIAASSSIFIAAPILLFLGDWRGRRRDASLDANVRAMMDSP
jgi:SecD/SecF fusion protein